MLKIYTSTRKIQQKKNFGLFLFPAFCIAPIFSFLIKPNNKRIIPGKKQLLLLLSIIIISIIQLNGQCVPNLNPAAAPDCPATELLCCGEIDGVFGTLQPFMNPTGPNPLCPGTTAIPDNMEWYSFVSETSSLTFVIQFSNCTNPGNEAGAQVGVVSDCTFTNFLFCNSSRITGPAIIPLNALIPGKRYYLFIDGWKGSVCDYSISVSSGSTFAPDYPTSPLSINGLPEVCSGMLSFYSAELGHNSAFNIWSFTPNDISFSTYGPGDNTVVVTDWGSAIGGTAEICVTGGNACNASTDGPTCMTVNVDQNPIVVQTESYGECENGYVFPQNGLLYSSGTHVIPVPSTDPANSLCDTIYELTVVEDVIDITFGIPPQVCPFPVPQDILFAEPSGGVFYGDGVVGDQFLADVPDFYLITYEYIDVYGCTHTSTFELEVSQNPNVTVNHPSTICPSSVAQDVLSPIPPGGTFDPSPILQNGLIVAPDPGVYTLTYRYGDPSTPCNVSHTFNIVVANLPQVQLQVLNPNVCLSNSPLDILQGSPEGGTYIVGNVNTANEFIPNQPGSNEIVYQYTNPVTGCSNTATMTIEVIDPDVPIISDPGVLCQDPNGQIQLITIPPNGLFEGDYVTSNGLFGPVAAGLHEVLFITDDNPAGCITSETITIEVSAATVINLDHPTNMCRGADPIMITPDPAGGTFSGTISPQGEFTPSQLGVNNLTYIFEDTHGCLTEFPFSIDVQEILTPQITGIPASVCFSQTDVYQLIGDPAGGLFSGNVNSSNEFIPNDLGVFTITYGPGPDNLCIEIEDIVVEVIPEISVQVNHPTEVCRSPLPMDILQVSPPGGVWTGPVTADGLFQAFDLGVNELTYSIIDPIAGCEGSTTIEIEVINTEDLFLPNLLTPLEPTYCIYEIVQFCIDPVPGATDYRWSSNFGIIENATTNHLCINIAWNALVEDQICITPIGECGPSNNVLCFNINVVDNDSCPIISTGIQEIESQLFSIFPNPAKDNIQIESSGLIHSLTLFNAMGKIIWFKETNGVQQLKTNISTEKSGVYFMLINGSHMEKVIIIN